MLDYETLYERVKNSKDELEFFEARLKEANEHIEKGGYAATFTEDDFLLDLAKVTAEVRKTYEDAKQARDSYVPTDVSDEVYVILEISKDSTPDIPVYLPFDESEI